MPNEYDLSKRKPRVNPEEEQRKKNIKKAREHLKEFFIYLQYSIPRGSFLRSDINAHINIVLKELEHEGRLFRKLWKGKLRLYKFCNCKLDLFYWRKCPEYNCIAEGDPHTEFHCPYKEKIEQDLHREYWKVEKIE